MDCISSYMLVLSRVFKTPFSDHQSYIIFTCAKTPITKCSDNAASSSQLGHVKWSNTVIWDIARLTHIFAWVCHHSICAQRPVF